MAGAYEKYENLTRKEKEYVKIHPTHIFFLKESRELAFSETKRIFGVNGRNDKSDAFRHCYWSALLSRKLGYINALEFTNAHESSSLNDPLEKTMDLHNNSVGLKIGHSKLPSSPLSNECIAALNADLLKVKP